MGFDPNRPARRAARKAAGLCDLCVKPLDNDGVTCSSCRRHANELRKRQPHNTAEKQRFQKLKVVYGLTVDEFSALWQKQNGQCGNSGCDTTLRYGKGQYAVDHNHSTGEVRGLLCTKCNVALGMLDDSLEKLAGLIEYLSNG